MSIASLASLRTANLQARVGNDPGLGWGVLALVATPFVAGTGATGYLLYKKSYTAAAVVGGTTFGVAAMMGFPQAIWRNYFGSASGAPKPAYGPSAQPATATPSTVAP